MGPRNRLGIGLSYRPARVCIFKPFKDPRNRFPAWRVDTTTLFVVPVHQSAGLHRLAESISRNRFLGSINVYKYGLGYIGLRNRLHNFDAFFKTFHGLLISLKIPSLSLITITGIISESISQKTLRRIVLDFLNFIQHFTCRPSDSAVCRRMLGLNPGLAPFWHQQSNARLDLIALFSKFLYEHTR